MKSLGFPTLLTVFPNLIFAGAFVLRPNSFCAEESPTSALRQFRVGHGPLRALPFPSSFFVPSSIVVTDPVSSSVSSTHFWISPNFALTAAVLASVLIATVPALLAKEESVGESRYQRDDAERIEVRTVRRQQTASPDEVGTIGRRGTVSTLVSGALGFAASDMLLGGLADIGSGMASTVYGARWNGLYSRIAQASARYGQEAAVASPELVAFISKSSAAVTNPELRAWIAAQRSFGKSRALVAAAGAAIAEEGVIATTVARTAVSAAAAVATSVTSDKTAGRLIDDETSDAVLRAALEVNESVACQTIREAAYVLPSGDLGSSHADERYDISESSSAIKKMETPKAEGTTHEN